MHKYSPVSKENTEAVSEAEGGFAANEDSAKLLEENQQLRAELEELQAKYDLLVQIIGDSGVEISNEE